MRSSSSTAVADHSAALVPQLGLQDLLAVGSAFTAESDPQSVVQAIVNQAHRRFSALAALLRNEGNRFTIGALAPASLDSNRALKRELTQTGTLGRALNAASARTETSLHRFEISQGPFADFDRVCCSPYQTASSRGLLILFLAPTQRMDESERTFLSALTKVGAMALSNAELCQNENSVSAERANVPTTDLDLSDPH